MITKNLLSILLVLSTGPALAAPAADNDTPRPARQSTGQSPGSTTGMMRYDTNKDGFVDRAEWDAGQEARFRQLDADKDGKLSLEELTANIRSDRVMQRQQTFFRLMDTDRDGFVSKAEFMTQAGKNFTRCDLDKDGRITTAECRQALRRQPVDRAARQDR